MNRALLIFILLAIPWLQTRADALASHFYAARGTYVLSPNLTLVISADPETRRPKYMLNYSDYGGNGQEIPVATPDDPFLTYWDVDTKTLWWATSFRVGYCNMSKQHSAISSSYERDKLHAKNTFPQAPAVFLAETERVLPIRR